MKKERGDAKDLFLRQNTTSAYTLEDDIHSKEQQKYNQATSDDTGREWQIRNFFAAIQGTLTTYHNSETKFI